MALLSIIKYPDPRLEESTQSVELFDQALRALAEDMIETMHTAPGIGLAAPQIGRSERITVVDLSAGSDPNELLVLVNPVVVTENGSVKEDEGCLSFPDLTLIVPRPEQVVVEAQNLDGVRFSIEAEDLLARCLHHEIDHLDGVLFLQRVSPLKRDLARRKIQKKIRAGEW
jgi:peptide deformylase